MSRLYVVTDFHEKLDSVKVVSHDETFHADDVVGVAIILLSTDRKVQLVRSRNESIIKTADVVIDVGRVYEPDAGRFDHHQSRNGTNSENHGFQNCASAGLVWDFYGEMVVERHFSSVPSLTQGIDLADIVREVYVSFIADIDSIDIGARRPMSGEYTFSHAVGSFNPTFNKEFDSSFSKAVEWVTPVLGAEINRAVAKIRDRKEAEEAFSKSEKVAVFNRYLNGWQDICPDSIERVVFPRIGGGWTVQRPEGREDLISQEEAEKLIGEDLIFIHAARFIGAAKTKEGAIALAKANL